MVRWIEKASGSANSLSSRFADCKSSNTRWPARICLAADHCVAGQRAPHELQHSFEADHFFERLRNEARVVDECVALITMRVELQQPTGDDLRQCLAAADEQRRDLHCDLVVAERQAVTVRERERGDRSRRRRCDPNHCRIAAARPRQ